MTHYSAAVLLPPTVDHEDRKAVEQYVEKVLEPYSEHNSTEEAWPRYVDEEWEKHYRRYFQVPNATDTELLTLLQKENGGEKYGVDDKGLYELVHWNPQGHHDYWDITDMWDEIPEICAVRDLPENFTTRAIVTGDGEWVMRGKVGFWGRTEENGPYSEWVEIYKTILAAHPDCYLVSLDCHT